MRISDWSSDVCSSDLLDGLVAGEDVDALVVGVARMPLHPAPIDLVASGGRVQALPQVAVLDRCAAGRLPVAAQPVGHPFGDALAHVLRVGVQDHAARLAQRSEEHTSELQSLMRISYAVFCL